MEMGAGYTKQCKVHGKVGECTQKEEREKGVHGSVGRAPKKRDLERECGGRTQERERERWGRHFWGCPSSHWSPMSSHKPCSHQETPYKVSMPCGDDQNFQH